MIQVLQKVKGSQKDPFLYLGIISVILIGIVTLAPNSFEGNLDNSFSLGSLSSQLSKNSEPFVGPFQFQAESPELNLVQENSLLASIPPVMVTPQVLGAIAEGFEPEDIRKVIVEYIVEPGDNLWSIAARFEISLETLLWANNLNKNSLIQPGQKLIIPPVSGVIHYVKAGDTVLEIAQKYKGKTEEIISFNGLSGEADIFVGDILIVPNGVLPPPPIKYAPQLVPLADSYFICPVSSPCRITQGLHWYNAIDFSNGKCGEPVYAVAGGEVLKVKITSSIYRWAFGGLGNHLTILHPNGVVTTYAHLATSFVEPGDQVSQGQIIALMGGAPRTPGAGLSTGCHVHFAVSGARNPFIK